MNKNRPLSLSSLHDGSLILDSQEIKHICNDVGLDMDENNITGLVVYLDESGADYKMAYVTESDAPYSLTAIYRPLPYYREFPNYSPNLPVYWKWFIYF